MSDTPLLGFPLMEAAQAQKHVTHNEALLKLDAAVHLSAASRSVATPPASPAEGDRYLIAASPTGVWTGHAGDVAAFEAGIWRFATPRAGWRLWIADEQVFKLYDGTIWRDAVTVTSLQNLSLLGVNTTADATNKLAVKSAAVLFDNVGGGVQEKFNKAAAADTASLLYQTGYSGRAEIGTTGDDDLHVKVSANGTSWNEAVVIDKDTGAVRFPAMGGAPVVDNDAVLVGLGQRLTDSEIAAAVAAAVATGRNRLVLRGTFLMPQGSNGIYLSGLTQPFVIHGEDALLLQDGASSGQYSNFVRAADCAEIRITGDIVMDFTVLPWFQGTCTATGTTTADIDLEAGYTCGFSTANFAYSYGTDGSRPKKIAFQNYASPAGVALLSGTTYRLSGVTGADFTVGERYAAIHSKSARHALRLERCAGVEVGPGVVIHAATGSGVHMQGCTGRIEVEAQATRKPGTSRSLSVTADMVHVANCRGACVIRNLVADGLGDDGVNIGQISLDVTSVPSATQFVGTRSANLSQSYVQAGDVLDIRNSGGVSLGQATVASVSEVGSTVTVNTVANLPGSMDATSYVENLSALPAYAEVRGCRIGFAFGAGTVVQSPNANVQHNSFYELFNAAVRAQAYMPAFLEGTVAGKVDISWNDCRECANTAQNNWNVIVCAAQGYDSTIPTVQVIDAPIVSHNVIRGSDHGAIDMGQAAAPTIFGNVIADVCRAPMSGTNPTQYTISIRSCSDPAVVANVYQDGAGTIGQIAANSGVVKIHGNVNFAQGAAWQSGTGSPEGVVAAAVASLYHRTDGGTGTSFYVKESGAGNTGWAAMAGAPFGKGSLVTGQDLINTVENGDLEMGDAGFSKNAWTIVSDPANAFFGNYVATSTDTSGLQKTVISAAYTTVAPGERVYAEAQVKTGAGVVPTHLRTLILWFDKDKVFLSASFGNDITAAQTTYTPSALAAAAPANSAFFRIHVEVTKTAAGAVYADAIRAFKLREAGKTITVGATDRLLGRDTPGAGAAEELTGTQATALLDTFTSALKGLAPASGGGTTNFLRADATWAAPAGGGGGDAISVNGAAATDADFDDATPAAPSGGVNVKWQKDAATPNNVSAYVPVSAVATPAIVTATPSANQNDYAPSGYLTTESYEQAIRVNGSASVKITGLAGGISAKKVTIKNASTDFLLWLEHENPASAAANRFTLPQQFPAFLMPGDYVTLIYDGTQSRWEVYNWPMRGVAMGLTDFTDWFGPPTPNTSGQACGPWGATFSGTGASLQASTYLVNTTEKPVGVIQLDSGTTATGRAFCGHQGTDGIVPTLGAALSVARLAIEAAVDGTNTYSVVTGFADVGGGTFTDGVAWEYRWTGSAAEWSQTRLANATATRSNTGSPTPDTNYVWLAVFVNPGWTRADFIYSTDSVSFTKSDSPTTGLPGSTRPTAYCACSIVKTAGTTQRNVSVDLSGLRVDQARA